MNQQVDFQTKVEEMILANMAISRIRPFADQPRKEFDEEELLGLANSIEEIGLQQPVSVKPIYDDPLHDFELIDGERRYRACKLIGLGHILAFILPDMKKDKQFALSVAANFCRVGHTPMETAFALRIIVDGFLKNGVDGEHLGKDECIEKAARIFGRSAGWASQHLSLLRLCPEVQSYLVKKEISFQIGIALTGLKEDCQLKFVRHIISAQLNHRSALAYIRNHRAPEVLSDKGRIRKPSDDYVIFQRTIGKMSEEFDNLLGMSMKKIIEMFKARPTGDFDAMVRDLEDLSSQAKLFAENLKRARR